MPCVGVNADQLFKGLGRVYTEKEFDDLCFDFGIELDDVVEEVDEKARSRGESSEPKTVYKIDIPANRYDLLCLEGLVRAMNIFLGNVTIPNFHYSSPPKHTITVSPAIQSVRPYVVGAVLRNVTLTHESYNSFLDLQDKLHFNICRRRTLVSVGTHDLDTLQGPFTYEALPPSDFEFVPLMPSHKSFKGNELMEYYRDKNNEDAKHLRPYTDIIHGFDRYPVFFDSNRVVMSLPPLINGNHSKMSVKTKNILIECTATDLNKANIVLNTLVAMFSEYCEDKFSVEPVEVIYPDGKKFTTPDLKTTKMEVTSKAVNNLIGIEIKPTEMVSLLKRMQIDSTYDSSSDKITTSIPITRSDVLHPVDIIEDVAIAFGYNNIEKKMPPTVTRGVELPINFLTEMLRIDLAAAGYTESLTLGLCSHDEAFKFLRIEDDGETAVVLSNPMSPEFQICRTSLLPGLLKTLSENKALPLKDGLKLFEVSDVVLLDPKNRVGAKNQRSAAALYIGPTAGIENIHGCLDRIMEVLGVEPSEDYSGVQNSGLSEEYFIRAANKPTFFPNFCAEVVIRSLDRKTERVIGHFGAIHPECLVKDAFDIKWPCSALEICIESLSYNDSE